LHNRIAGRIAEHRAEFVSTELKPSKISERKSVAITAREIHAKTVSCASSMRNAH